MQRFPGEERSTEYARVRPLRQTRTPRIDNKNWADITIGLIVKNEGRRHELESVIS
jgi:hypothetical protein